MNLLNYLFHYVLLTCKEYNIDESHSINHSMNVFYYANEIYNSELLKNPYLESQKNIIYTSAILHDMCDHKYIDERVGIDKITLFLEDKLTKEEIDITKKIISTMSYSKVKKNGFPNIGEYQLAYHIVREADLLTAYDFDRCIIYQMHHKNDDYITSINKASDLFENRMLKHIEDNMFITDFSKREALRLHKVSLNRIAQIKGTLH